MSFLRSEPLVISISGASSSGKTTLAYQLHSLFSPNRVSILQLDDFCKEVSLLPRQPNGLPDADAVASVDMAAFKAALIHFKETGRLPNGSTSWQDPHELAEAKRKAVAMIDSEMMREAQQSLRSTGVNKSIGIVEGFLLYHDEYIRSITDIKLFLRTSKAVAKNRRMCRPGYGDPDTKDFWRTEGYFEQCVWANYVKENAWMFVDGNVEGAVVDDLLGKEAIVVTPHLDMSVEDTFRWAVKVLGDAIQVPSAQKIASNW